MWWKRLLCLVAAVALASMSLTSCNTVRGVGKDLERGGQKIQGR